jgi:hypothetical protein
MSNLNDFVALPVRNDADAVGNAYQERSNMKMSLSAVLPKDYDRQSLNTLQPGEKTFRFSKGSLFGDCILKVTVNGWAPTSAFAMRQEKGYGYRYISSFSYKYGNSNEYRVTGRANLLHVMDASPDQTQKLRILELGGEAKSYINVSTVTGKQELMMILALPHSGPPGHCCVDKIPYDSRLLEDDLEIKITFADGKDIYGNYADFVNNGQVFPTFTAEVIMEKFSFVDPRASMAMAVKDGGRNEYAFMYPNQIQESRLTYNLVSGFNQIQSTLSGWRQGTTTSILLALIPDRNYSTVVVTDPAVYGLPEHNLAVQIYDIEVILDGQSIVQMKGNESSLRSLLRGPEDEFPMGDANDGYQSPYTTIRLSQFAKKSILGENSQEPGVELVSKTLQFRLSTPSSTVQPTGYTLIAVQNINASLETASLQNKIRFV